MKIEEALAKVLSVEGVHHVFGLMDMYNMDFLLALGSERIELIRVRHEHGAVCMADGYTRVSDRIGVCCVGAGPALAHVASALTTAQRAGSPVLVIFSDTPATERHNLKRFNAKDFVESLEVKYFRVRAASTFFEDARLALRHIYSGKGPAVLSVPVDVLQQDIGRDFPYRKLEMPDLRIHPSPDVVAYAAHMLRAAKRPVILAGNGAVAARSRGRMEELAERTGALLGTTLPAKDYFEGNPFNVGVVGTRASDAAVTLVSQADCVFALGASLTRLTTVDGTLLAKAKVIQVDHDSAKLGDRLPVHLAILGDAAATVEAINAVLSREAGAPKTGYRSEEARALIAKGGAKKRASYVQAEGRLDPNQVVDELDRLLPKERTIAGGGFFERDGMHVPEPDAMIGGNEFGALGISLPLAIGAALGNPDRHTVLFIGDGAFLMFPQELDTAVRHRIPMTMVIMNNRAYGSEARMLESRGKPIESVLFETPNLADIGRAFGAVARNVTTVEELRVAASEAGKYDRPFVWDVSINLDVVHKLFQGRARLTEEGRELAQAEPKRP